MKIWDLEADKCREEFVPVADAAVRSVSIVSTMSSMHACMYVCMYRYKYLFPTLRATMPVLYLSARIRAACWCTRPERIRSLL